MLIGRVVTETGLSRDTVRYYERRGLIAPAFRRENGYKEYSAETVARLKFVRMLQRAGFTLRDAAAFLELHAAGEATCANVGPLVTRQLAEIDARIAELQAMRRELEAAFRQCKGKPRDGACAPVKNAFKNME